MVSGGGPAARESSGAAVVMGAALKLTGAPKLSFPATRRRAAGTGRKRTATRSHLAALLDPRGKLGSASRRRTLARFKLQEEVAAGLNSAT